jgi:hypothetical protein
MGAFLSCPQCKPQQPCVQKECDCPTCPTCEVCKQCEPQKVCPVCSKPNGFADGVWKIDPLEYRKSILEKHPALASTIPPEEIISQGIERSGMQIPSLHVKQVAPTVLRVHSNIPLGAPILAGEKTPHVYFDIESQENGDFTARKGFAGTFMIIRYNKERDQLAVDVDVKNSRLPGFPSEARQTEKLPPPLIFHRVETFSLEMVKEYQNETWFQIMVMVVFLILLAFLLFGREKKS